MGEYIEISRPLIPTSFQGGWDNLFVKIEGFRAVDWLDWLLHGVKCVVVPFIERNNVRKALLCLVRACELALNWCITETQRKEIAR